jgi:Double zinc ribbon/Adenylate and Guanylate cyclase catalytic domain
MAVPEGLSMRCPRCQHENREGARFCEACGGPLTQTCPACGHRPRPGAAFCDHCGTPLPGTTAAATPPALAPRPKTLQAYTPAHLAEKILTAKTALEGERKQVTALFADLKSSMELLADRDPEASRRLLDPVLERMMAAVHRYEGTVNQVMGDGIMALFGAPIAHEDHAVRACYAALAMQEAIGRYSAAERQPVLAVWEDLHWADPSTLELLSLISDQVPTARLLTLMTSRPEFRPPWAPRSHFTRLTLGRLPRPQVETMVRQLTADKPLPAEVLAEVVAKTDGVPLFVEELVKMLLESGLVREEADRYAVVGPLPPLAIPATVQDSLMARLD